jgi:hypothetical protein
MMSLKNLKSHCSFLCLPCANTRIACHWLAAERISLHGLDHYDPNLPDSDEWMRTKMSGLHFPCHLDLGS